MIPLQQRVFRIEPSRFLSTYPECLERSVTPLVVLASVLGERSSTTAVTGLVFAGAQR